MLVAYSPENGNEVLGKNRCLNENDCLAANFEKWALIFDYL